MHGALAPGSCSDDDRARMFDANARPSGGHMACYESTQAFADRAGRLLELGFDELGLYYPPLDRQRPVFDQVAREVIPTLRASHADRAS